ncbi:MAG: CoA-binding protein [Planctomycetes bacterium]|nr:CoA-binding protein [Planctomycetota bacterium]
MDSRIESFLAGSVFAVAGASADRAKYGNKVLRAYQQAGRKVFGIHPRETKIEGAPSFAKLSELPEKIDGLSIVTPPAVTEKLVEEAAAAGVKRLWMQPGAESPAAIARAKELGLELISGGPCVLVALHYQER